MASLKKTLLANLFKNLAVENEVKLRSEHQPLTRLEVKVQTKLTRFKVLFPLHSGKIQEQCKKEVSSQSSQLANLQNLSEIDGIRKATD